jgi:uncharacterized protein
MMMMTRRLLILAFFGGLVFAQRPAAQSTADAERLAYIKANYTKSEFQIPMRDGVRLFTAVYAPKDRRRSTLSC